MLPYQNFLKADTSHAWGFRPSGQPASGIFFLWIFQVVEAPASSRSLKPLSVNNIFERHDIIMDACCACVARHYFHSRTGNAVYVLVWVHVFEFGQDKFSVGFPGFWGARHRGVGGAVADCTRRRFRARSGILNEGRVPNWRKSDTHTGGCRVQVARDATLSNYWHHLTLSKQTNLTSFNDLYHITLYNIIHRI